MLEFDNFMIRYTPNPKEGEKEFDINYYIMENRTPISNELLASLMPMPVDESLLKERTKELCTLLLDKKLLNSDDNYCINSKAMIFIRNEKGHLFLPFENTSFSDAKGYFYPEGLEEDENKDVITALNSFKLILDKASSDIITYLKSKK